MSTTIDTADQKEFIDCIRFLTGDLKSETITQESAIGYLASFTAGIEIDHERDINDRWLNNDEYLKRRVDIQSKLTKIICPWNP